MYSLDLLAKNTLHMKVVVPIVKLTCHFRRVKLSRPLPVSCFLFLCCSLHFVWLCKCVSLLGVFFVVFISETVCMLTAMVLLLHIVCIFWFVCLSLSEYKLFEVERFLFCSSMKGKKVLVLHKDTLSSCIMCHVQLKMLLRFLDKREVFEVETVTELVSCIHLYNEWY